jgi:hypothetical protein
MTTGQDDIAYLTGLADELGIIYRANLDAEGRTIYEVLSHHCDRDNIVVIATLTPTEMEIWVHATEEEQDRWKHYSELASRSFEHLHNGLAKRLELGV